MDYFTRFTPQKTFSLKTFTEENNYQVTTYLLSSLIFFTTHRENGTISNNKKVNN